MDHNIPILFQQFDSDHDGRIHIDEAYNLLKQIGHNIYKGSVAKVSRLLNYTTPDDNQHFTLSQLQQFANALQTKAKFQIWKNKYYMKRTIFECRQESTAAPNFNKGNGQNGDVLITVGPKLPNYTHNIHISLQKKQKQQSKPFLKLIIEASSNQEAKKIAQLINQIYKNITQLIKTQMPDYQQQINKVHLITNVQNKIVSLFVTVSSQDLIQLLLFGSQMLDNMIGTSIQGFCDFKFGFNFDINQFITNPQINFYDVFCKNSKIHFKWTGSNFINNIKQTLLQHNFFEDMKYNNFDPGLIIIMGLLSLEKCNGVFEFQNAQYQSAELQSKHAIIQLFGQLKQALAQYEKSQEVKKLLSLIKDRISIQASLGNWKLNAQIDVKNLTKLFTQDIVAAEHEYDSD